MKPNAHELAECVGRELVTFGDVIDAARQLNGWGIDCVMASLGVDGILAVTSSHAIHARTAPVKVINTVGAGDSTIAGFLAALATHPVDETAYGVGFDIAEGIASAVQWERLKSNSQPVDSRVLKTLCRLPLTKIQTEITFLVSQQSPKEQTSWQL